MAFLVLYECFMSVIDVFLWGKLDLQEKINVILAFTTILSIIVAGSMYHFAFGRKIHFSKYIQSIQGLQFIDSSAKTGTKVWELILVYLN